ncbi:MAG TPA: TOBE domain-containing protein [bacterium]|jgi:molybdopterin-binding protein
MEDYLTVQQAAALLHFHAKRVQALARAGKLPAVRAGRKWLFPRSALLARLRGAGNTAVPSAAQLSGRNQLKGRIAAISVDGVMAEVRIEIGGHELVSIITRASVERLGLKVGDEATAVIKATDVMIGRA